MTKDYKFPVKDSKPLPLLQIKRRIRSIFQIRASDQNKVVEKNHLPPARKLFFWGGGGGHQLFALRNS